MKRICVGHSVILLLFWLSISWALKGAESPGTIDIPLGGNLGNVQLTSSQYNRQLGLIRAVRPGGRFTTFASGFVFGTNNDVVTCNHVWEDAIRNGWTNLVYVIGGEEGSCALSPKLFFTNEDIAVFST